MHLTVVQFSLARSKKVRNVDQSFIQGLVHGEYQRSAKKIDMKDGTVGKMKRAIATKYDVLADAYDSLYGDEQEAKIRSVLESLQLRETDLVLDVGCGTGILFRHIEEKVGFIVGLDISRGLLERARNRSRYSSKISLIRADADYLPFPDEIFDGLFAVTVLQNMPDSKATLNQILRKAKREAFLVVTGLKKSFRKDQFLRILFEAGLDIVDIKENGRLLGFVALCEKKNKYK